MLTVRQVTYTLLPEVVIDREVYRGEFVLGEEVEWHSCGTHKCGIVFEVVMSGCYPGVLCDFRGYDTSRIGNGGVRKVVSYLVLVVSDRGKKCIYWPKTENLMKV